MESLICSLLPLPTSPGPRSKKNLRSGETASNRPDLVAPVFRAKLRKLLNLLTKEGVFGRSVAHTFVVEFPKRGLPHAHIVLILAEADKPTTPA